MSGPLLPNLNVPGPYPIAESTCVCGPEPNFAICLFVNLFEIFDSPVLVACPPFKNRTSFSLTKARNFSEVLEIEYRLKTLINRKY